MKNSHKKKVTIGNENIGIGMIASSLLVILFAVVVFLQQQKIEDTDEIQRQGTSLVRLLGSMSVVQLVGEDNDLGTLRLLNEVRVNQYFSYASVVNIDGSSLFEILSPGVTTPSVFIPRQPSHWIGEREYTSDTGMYIKEFYAPIMDSGELKAFIRLGYSVPGYALSTTNVRLLAILAMAIFMLTPIFYFMIKKEFDPLTSISEQLQALINKTEKSDPEVNDSQSNTTKDFMDKFSTVVETAYQQIDTLEAKQTNTVVSNKLLVYQIARLESALNALPYAILVADESGQVSYTSNKVHSFLGTHEGNILGRNLSDLCDNREVSEYLVGCQVNNTANVYQQDDVEILLDETGMRMSVNTYPLYSQKNESQLLGTVIVFRDMAHENVGQKQDGEFVAHVAHELKTPLNILFMYSETLVDCIDESREQAIEAANVIHDETDRITQMINNLLNLAMIEMGTVAMHRQRVKMGDFLEDIYQSMSHDKQTESLDFDLTLPHDLGVLSIDKDLVRVSINNLISNAIKYNQPGGKIELKAEENDTEIIIRVLDSGIGISEQDQHRVFEKFFRSEDEETRKRTGHGLGLSLVQETVKLHNGKINIHSTQGEGTEFVMSFSKESNMLKDAI
jgi:signal transduction histidine kinase